MILSKKKELKFVRKDELFREIREWHLKSVFLGEMYYVHSQTRYWGKDSFLYYGSESFHLNLVSATEFADNNRQKGKSWTIEVIPAIVLTEFIDALIIVEINERNPFKKLFELDYKKPLLKNILDVLKDKTSENYYFFRAKINDVFHLRFPLTAHKSVSYGGHLPLDWEETYNFNDPENAIKVVYKLSLALAGKFV